MTYEVILIQLRHNFRCFRFIRRCFVDQRGKESLILVQFGWHPYIE